MTNGNNTTTAAAATTTTTTMGDNSVTASEPESSLSVRTNESGLVVASTTLVPARNVGMTSSVGDIMQNTRSAAAVEGAATGTPSSSASVGDVSVQDRDTKTAATASSSTSLSPALDFITTGNAVKALFSIPYDDSPDPVFLAIHNINGTLLVDEAESEQNYDQNRVDLTDQSKASGGGNNSSPARTATTATPKNLPSSEDLALALSTTHLQTKQHQQESQALSNILSTLLNRPFGEGGDDHHDDEEKTNSSSNTGQLAPPIAPREFIEWKFQDFNLMVGSDALIVRPATTAPDDSTAKSASSSAASGDGIAIRVENKDVLQRAWEACQVRQRQQYHGRDKPLLTDFSSSASSSSSIVQEVDGRKDNQSRQDDANATTNSRVSYAQILKQQPEKTTVKTHSLTSKKDKGNAMGDTEKDGESMEVEHPQNEQQIMKSRFSEMPLQTCIVPHHGQMIGDGHIINDPTLSSSPSSPGHDSTSSEPSAIAVVLDAYLDNLMANVPQLALCLQEKGLIQSVKLLQTQEIPSKLIHPSTYDAVEFMGSSSLPSVSSAQEDAFFSPQIMDMNATALLRFLKTNCTRNNSTYLLRHEPVIGPLGKGQAGLGQRQIQLYDISSISTQGQKKWIWWLATMSHRFALRLRHLETAPSSSSSFSEAQKRELRDRQRSLYQQTLDLLQDLKDMDGGNHESMVASVWEHMADTFLGHSTSGGGVVPKVNQSTTSTVPSSQTPKTALSTTTVQLDAVGPSHIKSDRNGKQSMLNEQPYKDESIDALNKAQDYLLHAINTLGPSVKNAVDGKDEDEALSEAKISSSTKRRRKRPGRNADATVGGNVSTESDAMKGRDGIGVSLSPIILQLFGLNHKLIDVSLSLIGHYLRSYQSSNATHAVRTTARKLADSIRLMETCSESLDRKQAEMNATNLRVQYMRLYETCGHFARSFASDVLWRERGHASGDDVVSVIRDVDTAFGQNRSKSNRSLASVPHYFWWKQSRMDTLPEKSHDLVTLESLSGVVSRHGDAVSATKRILAKENVLVRDRMKVLVASCMSYDRVTSIFPDTNGTDSNPNPVTYSEPSQRLTLQLLGDSCNETGKLFLNTLRNHLVAIQGKTDDPAKRQAATGMLDSAQFWFGEGLDAFDRCGDVQNRSLLRMNVCQSYKLRANSVFDSSTKEGQTRSPASINAERSLEDAIGQLEKAHEELGQRDVAPYVWDMVSAELASTLLLLGTRRRQYILGDGGNHILLALTRRLQPGQEHAIIDPMEKALQIYTERGNDQQAAAVHYQLALTFSKLWTCQVNETKTRQKLSSAFDHYQKAHAYFFSHLSGNESVFCLLCMDLAKLYSNIPGETTLLKALGCCLDTCDVFSMESIQTAIGDEPTSTQSSEWLEKMTRIAQSVDETTFKNLRILVQLENGGNRYKNIYRAGLTAKMTRNVLDEDERGNWLRSDTRVANLLTLNEVLVALKGIYPSLL